MSEGECIRIGYLEIDRDPQVFPLEALAESLGTDVDGVHQAVKSLVKAGVLRKLRDGFYEVQAEKWELFAPPIEPADRFVDHTDHI